MIVSTSFYANTKTLALKLRSATLFLSFFLFFSPHSKVKTKPNPLKQKFDKTLYLLYWGQIHCLHWRLIVHMVLFT